MIEKRCVSSERVKFSLVYCFGKRDRHADGGVQVDLPLSVIGNFQELYSAKINQCTRGAERFCPAPKPARFSSPKPTASLERFGGSIIYSQEFGFGRVRSDTLPSTYPEVEVPRYLPTKYLTYLTGVTRLKVYSVNLVVTRILYIYSLNFTQVVQYLYTNNYLLLNNIANTS